jgi:two-component system KDP operon response regulator KdpE
MRLLLLEDDQVLGDGLRDYLRTEGHVVDWCQRVGDAALLVNEPYDALLIDWQLPDGSGLDWLRRLRQRGLTTPVLMLTARDLLSDRVRGLDGGADDYLVKPFGVAELLARMRVALRHRGQHQRPAVLSYRQGALDIDLAAHRVRRHGQEVHLTPTEFKLLARLVRQTGQVVTHRQLLADVWGAEHVADTHYLRLYMAQLRGKLEADPTEPQLLLTETGVGYRLADAEAPRGDG